MKADRDSKSQEAQRLTEELHNAKEAADDEYQALSATCVQNQQTCERKRNGIYYNIVSFLCFLCIFAIPNFQCFQRETLKNRELGWGWG